METFQICTPEDVQATCWIRRAVFTLVVGIALLALAASFAVEFSAVTVPL
jgi:hypothetical protein